MRRYLVLILLAMLTVSACESINPPPPTPFPFNRFIAQNVLDAFTAANLQFANPTREMTVGRGAPSRFEDRYVFEIPIVEPEGGQLVIFRSPDQLAEWQQYIEQLRSSSDTRRSVAYVFVHANVLLQLNANLTRAQAQAYADALAAMG